MADAARAAHAARAACWSHLHVPATKGLSQQAAFLREPRLSQTTWTPKVGNFDMIQYDYDMICLGPRLVVSTYQSAKSWSESQLGYVGMIIPSW